MFFMFDILFEKNYYDTGKVESKFLKNSNASTFLIRIQTGETKIESTDDIFGHFLIFHSEFLLEKQTLS